MYVFVSKSIVTSLSAVANFSRDDMEVVCANYRQSVFMAHPSSTSVTEEARNITGFLFTRVSWVEYMVGKSKFQSRKSLVMAY